jgi:hypothetical protein
MELFASTRLEISERARFISLVSSLEPLAVPRKYPESTKNLIDIFNLRLKETDFPELSPEDNSKVKNSLTGRLLEL